jgi:predicted DNA-binding WGR domain protein
MNASPLPDSPSPALPAEILPAEGPVVLRRIDPARRMARFYTLQVELTLFQDWSCRREHGRIGSRGGRVMIGLYARKDEALAALATLLRAKRRRGYQLVEAEGPGSN